MKILGIDSSGLVASVALVEDDELVAEFTTNYKKTHSQTLLPMLDELRNMVELDLGTVDAIAIASGPGSFTGLRIGSATAKGLGLALGKPLVEVPTLEGLAWNLYMTERLVCPLMDARRNQVYSAAYEFLPEAMPETLAEGMSETMTEAMPKTLPGAQLKAGAFRLHTVIPQMPIDIEEMMEKLNRCGRAVVFLGDGVPVYRKAIEACCKVDYGFAAAGNNRQRAASIASLGAVYFAQGRAIPAGEHRPEYLRRSQAEQEAERAKKD